MICSRETALITVKANINAMLLCLTNHRILEMFFCEQTIWATNLKCSDWLESSDITASTRLPIASLSINVKMTWKKLRAEDKERCGKPVSVDEQVNRKWKCCSTRFIILWLLALGLYLHSYFPPLFRLPKCLHRNLTYEERAIKILSGNPLIGW